MQKSALNHENQGTEDFLTIYIKGQMFGIPVLKVQDVLGNITVTKVPLAPPEVSGSLNLRGRIVTAINVQKRLGIEGAESNDNAMNVVVEQGNELYSLIIDSVGDVLSLNKKDFEQTPSTLDPVWREISMGIYRYNNKLMVVMDVERLLNAVHNE